ncbi:hypothetical protein Q31b_45300 [Novipirellula aureliae]|uniref:Transposase DDE domain-containing protein n=1 Tax=Novipirellula aureliae TaxID=2527966 RepID=A0A5C6DQ09_9BACT|nr:hypothetical protein [Novipirellula aureliae]TWU37741.1 hypothetical protein Q31b_45300 [Novipirellula aureliae]
MTVLVLNEMVLLLGRPIPFESAEGVPPKAEYEHENTGFSDVWQQSAEGFTEMRRFLNKWLDRRIRGLIHPSQVPKSRFFRHPCETHSVFLPSTPFELGRRPKEESKIAYRRRRHFGETPFAVIKVMFDLRRFLLRGIEGVE